MLTLGQQRLDVLTLVAVACLGAALLAVGVAAPVSLPWAVAGVGVLALLFYWALRWDVTMWAWLWVISYGLLNWPQWRIEITGFFNLTPPRLILLGTVLGYGMFFFLHRERLRMDRALLWVMLLLLGYLAVSATEAGWTARTVDPQYRTAPYYMFIGSLLLPFVMFFLLYNSARREDQIRRALLLITMYGWYALYIGYLQYAAIQGVGWARGLIWPAFINDPQWGIHFDRARGAFAGASPQAVFLVLLFYVDLYLLRKVRGPYRLALILQAVLCPAAIFFTLLRSAYLSFLLCGMIWVIFSSRQRRGWLKLAFLLVVLAVGVYAFWPRLSSTDRAAGGVAQRGPVYSRFVLAAQTWEIFKTHPVRGVGFGHFVEAQRNLPKDQNQLAGRTYGELVQHNLFLNMLSETGLIGLVLTVMVFWLLLRQSRQLYRKLPPEAAGDISRDFVVLFWVILANYLIDAMFRNPLWHPFSNAMLWSFAGLVVCFNRLLEPQPLDLPIVRDDSER